MSEEKPTYEELELENKKLIAEKIDRQKAAMHTLREMCLTLTHLCGVNKLPAKIDLILDYDRDNFIDYVSYSMRGN